MADACRPHDPSPLTTLADLFTDALRSAYAVIREADGLSWTQLQALHLLNGAEDVKMIELARQLHLVPGSTTAVVGNLVATGMAERIFDPEDRRAVRARITDDGRRCRARFDALRQEAILAAVAQAPPAARGEVRAALDLLRDACNASQLADA